MDSRAVPETFFAAGSLVLTTVFGLDELLLVD